MKPCFGYRRYTASAAKMQCRTEQIKKVNSTNKNTQNVFAEVLAFISRFWCGVFMVRVAQEIKVSSAAAQLLRVRATQQ